VKELTKKFIKLENTKNCENLENNQSSKMVKEFNKSFSNVSTTSIESGVCDLYFDDEETWENANSIDKMTLGDTVKQILKDANNESRLICGLSKVSEYLNSTEYPEHSLFFFIAPSANSDSVTHMSEIVLQSFCFEYDIYIVKVDSAQKLNKILGSDSCDTCALVQRSASIDPDLVDDAIDLDKFTELENTLIDHCEDFWSEPVQPIIRLPEK
jgi:growth arrest and DNA-damage-inducible protein